jgi:hypothetical protein
MEAKRKVEELPQSRSNRELWERINAPGSTRNAASAPKVLAQPKPRTFRSKAYLAWVRMRPCLICGKASEAAHTGPHGVSIKAPDFRAVPLCPFHHRWSNGLDILGPERFEEMYNIDLKETVLTQLNEYLTSGHTLEES